MTKRKDEPLIAGIYQWLNKKNGRSYVGSSRNIWSRHKSHQQTLRGGRSGCTKLQYAWNKYGEDKFEFKILQLLPRSFTKAQLVVFENMWMDFLDTIQNGYNCSHADRYGKEVRAKPFKLMSPDGVIHEGFNISEFALENGLNPPLLNHVVQGKRISHNGWTLVNPRKSKRIKTKYRLRSPEGEIIEGEYLAKLCREHDLDQSTMHHVLSGKVKEHKGWSNADRDDYERISAKEFILVDPEGNIVKGRNISKFAKQKGLVPQGLTQLVSGRVLVSQGYRLPENAHIKQPERVGAVTLRSPEGEIVIIECLADFTRNTDLNPDYLSKVFRGEVRYYKRWSRVDDEPAPLTKALPGNTIKVRILNPKGELIESESIAKLCNEYRLAKHGISALLKGEKESHSGWKLPK